MSFRLSAEPLDPAALKAELTDPRAGAYAAFEGWVRNHNDGRTVERLEYEAYAELALKEGERILADARERFGLLRAACAHRVGRLEIGGLAVWVGVASAHRREAFAACRYIIDAIKARAPIWKKEYYTNGDSGWVHCEHCAAHGLEHARSPRHDEISPRIELTEADYYRRQTVLPDVGPGGQECLRQSRVLVIGAGGLGGPVLSYLAAAGVGQLTICEDDRLEATNLHRQTLFAASGVGQPKSQLAANRLRALNPFVTVRPVETRLEPGNAEALFRDHDMVVDCTDNFETKFLINDAAVSAGVPAILASIYQYEGQLQVVDVKRDSACLRCLWPETPPEGCVGACADAGVLGAVPGVFGSLQAMEALKRLLDLPGQLSDHLILFDLLNLTTRRIPVPRNEKCGVCGSGAPSMDSKPAAAASNADLDVSASELPALLSNGAILVDVRDREAAAQRPLPFDGVEVRPAGEWEGDPPASDRAAVYVLCCARGVRSRGLARYMRAQGFERAYSLKGGAQALEHFPAERV